MSTSAQKFVKISVNGKRIANVIGVESFFEREYTVSGSTLSVKEKSISVVIKREKILGDSRTDEVQLRMLSKFSLTVEYTGAKSSFSDCEWISFKETIAKDGTVTEEMTVTATKNTFTV